MLNAESRLIQQAKMVSSYLTKKDFIFSQEWQVVHKVDKIPTVLKYTACTCPELTLYISYFSSRKSIQIIRCDYQHTQPTLTQVTVDIEEGKISQLDERYFMEKRNQLDYEQAYAILKLLIEGTSQIRQNAVPDGVSSDIIHLNQTDHLAPVMVGEGA